MTVRRTIVVGDVHGCLAELDALLAEVGWRSGDRLVCVGDLVAKGPDSVGVVRRLRALGADAVLGNHDAKLLEVGRAPSPDAPAALANIARAMSEQDWAWLASLPLALPLPEHEAIVVHAGLVPGVPLEAQRPRDMLEMRSIRADGSPTKHLEQGVPWASLWPGPTHVYFGHDAVRGLQRYPHATGLDTGCVYGGRLTACVLPSREIVSVRAARSYAGPADGWTPEAVVGGVQRR